MFNYGNDTEVIMKYKIHSGSDWSDRKKVKLHSSIFIHRFTHC